MFQVNLLKSGLVAATFIEAFVTALTSAEDQRDFPEFAAAMAVGGFGYQW